MGIAQDEGILWKWACVSLAIDIDQPIRIGVLGMKERSPPSLEILPTESL